jgi:hypothetical protein
MDLIAVVSARLNRWFDPRNITRVTIIKEAVSEWAYLGKKKKSVLSVLRPSMCPAKSERDGAQL